MITDRESRFITLSTAFTPVIRRGRHPIISPDEDSPSLPPTNLNNQFAAIAPSQQPDDSDSDDDNDQSSQGTIQSVTSDDDYDYGTTTMTTTHRKTIADLMTEVIPMTEPNQLELQSFRKELANALKTQTSRGMLTGHAHKGTRYPVLHSTPVGHS